MSELVIVGFDNVGEADRVLTELGRLGREHLIDLEDAVVAVRDAGGKTRIKQSVDLVGVGAAQGGLSGALWGSLIGLLFLNPLLGAVAGAAVGAGTGALTGSAVDYGIDDGLIRQIADTLQPGTSALFLLIRKVQPEKVLADLQQFSGRVIRSSLSPDLEARLNAALTHTPAPTAAAPALAPAAAPVAAATTPVAGY